MAGKHRPTRSMINHFVTSFIDNSVRMAHDPNALRQIGPEERRLLGQILIKLVILGPKTCIDFYEALDGPNHHLYENTAWLDLSTIEFTFPDMFGGPSQFYAPLLGGRAFLGHILECSSCLTMLADNTVSIGESEQLECIHMMEAELAKWNIRAEIEPIDVDQFLKFFRGQ